MRSKSQASRVESLICSMCCSITLMLPGIFIIPILSSWKLIPILFWTSLFSPPGLSLILFVIISCPYDCRPPRPSHDKSNFTWLNELSWAPFCKDKNSIFRGESRIAWVISSQIQLLIMAALLSRSRYCPQEMTTMETSLVLMSIHFEEAIYCFTGSSPATLEARLLKILEVILGLAVSGGVSLEPSLLCN